MTWGKLKEIVEGYKFFDDDTEVIVYDCRTQLRHELATMLYHDAHERITLSTADYRENGNSTNSKLEMIEDAFWDEEMWDKMNKLMAKKAKERYEQERSSCNTLL